MPANKYQQIDVWWCSRCHREWYAPSVPHNPNCPKCSLGGWWRRFATTSELNQLVNTPRDV